MKLPKILGALVLSLPSAVLAHDFWIEPSQFAPGVPASVSLSLKVGERFTGRGVRRQADSIQRFVAVGPQGTSAAVPGLEGRDPAGFLRIDAPGAYLIGYETRGQRIELEADRFEGYLREEGLEHVIESRREAGETDAPGREIFVRCAKTLLRTEDVSGTTAGEPRLLGLSLELLLEDAAPDPGSETRPIRLLYGGEPVSGVLIAALRRGGPQEPVAARTDAEGRVDLPLGAGVWLIKGVHMVRADLEPDADWKSYWASLTLFLPESTKRP